MTIRVRLIRARAALRRTAARSPAIPASGILAPADKPRRVRVRASCRDASSFEKRPHAFSDAGFPPPPAETLRQFARGTHIVRGEEARTFLRLTRSCLIFACRPRRNGTRDGKTWDFKNQASRTLRVPLETANRSQHIEYIRQTGQTASTYHRSRYRDTRVRRAAATPESFQL